MNTPYEPDHELEDRLSRRLLDTLIRAGLVLTLVLLCYHIFSPFLTMMLWALILAVTLYPLQQKLAKRLGAQKNMPEPHGGQVLADFPERGPAARCLGKRLARHTDNSAGSPGHQSGRHIQEIRRGPVAENDRHGHGLPNLLAKLPRSAPLRFPVNNPHPQ